jgi:peptide/nickel transport system substrate-binding protein
MFEPTKAVSNTRIVGKRYTDHPHADNINWKEVQMEAPNPDQLIPAIQNDRLDASKGGGITNQQAQSFPDHWFSVSAPFGGGWALALNYQSEIYSDLNVRQAFAHIVNNDQFFQNMGELRNKIIPPQYSGLNTTVRSRLVTDELVGAMNKYDSRDEATQLLEKAGFSKDGGSWMRPDGSPFEPVVHTAPLSVLKVPAQTMSTQLNEFGIKSSVSSHEITSFFDAYSQAEYYVSIGFWGDESLNPYDAYLRSMTGFDGKGISYPETHQIPPVGEPDKEKQEVSTTELLNRTRTATGEEYQSLIQ